MSVESCQLSVVTKAVFIKAKCKKFSISNKQLTTNSDVFQLDHLVQRIFDNPFRSGLDQFGYEFANDLGIDHGLNRHPF